MPTSSPIQTWSPTVSRHGNETFTWPRTTTPRPTPRPERPPHSATRKAEGHGTHVWKNAPRTRVHSASFQAGAPRAKSELS